MAVGRESIGQIIDFLKIFVEIFDIFLEKRRGKNYHVIFQIFTWSQLVACVIMHSRKILLGTKLYPYWSIIGRIW